MQGTRPSVVGDFRLVRCACASVIHFGDSTVVHPVSSVLIVGQDLNVYDPRVEPDFARLGLFGKPLPAPFAEPETVTMICENENSSIRVDRVKLVSLAASSVVHIGSTGKVEAENRTKRVRVL